ncbi:MAG: hypothetical protein BGN86_07935 [Caulobacterales bacterium 68-7]|nr:hypothetical protein [Caulobacterales bacterium]OJU07736.1 MAG: hypothetical protein BGN86_07935 [Caulobacterales bacterium 68-7]
MDDLYDHVQRLRTERRRKSALPPGVLEALAEGAMQADAAVRGAANVLTFGLADKLAAGADAVAKGGPLSQLPQRYAAEAREEADRNRYDAEHRRVAQTAGQVGGTVLGFAAVPGSTAGSAARLAGAAPITLREGASILGAGAATGVGAQAVGDMALYQRSSPGDYAGAALGGMAGAAAVPFVGAGRAGAIDGAVTSAAQDVFNGRPISVQDAGSNAVVGRAGARVAEKAALNELGKLSGNGKGRLGESLGPLRSLADWQPRDLSVRPGTRDPIPNDPRRRYWIPDGWRGERRFEDKFGPSADLSPNQRLARAGLDPTEFQLNHFLPKDVVAIFSRPISAVGAQASSRKDGNRQ